MGKLVGGKQVQERSEGGTYKCVGSGERIYCEYDIVTYANEEDARHKIASHIDWYGVKA